MGLHIKTINYNKAIIVPDLNNFLQVHDYTNLNIFTSPQHNLRPRSSVKFTNKITATASSVTHALKSSKGGDKSHAVTSIYLAG